MATNKRDETSVTGFLVLAGGCQALLLIVIRVLCLKQLKNEIVVVHGYTKYFNFSKENFQKRSANNIKQ
jgi:hypothetical protein